MKPENILLSTKQTEYEYFKSRYKDLTKILSPNDLGERIEKHKEHYASFNHIKKVLDSAGIPYQRVYMPYAAFPEFKERDLVIAIGGDGTVLNTAQFILDETPVLTVKSEHRSVGALCTIDATGFENALEKILNGKFKIEKWTRAEGQLDNELPELALNEISINHKYGQFARYEVSFNGIKERQGSTGMIVSTGVGSGAWYVTIAGNDGIFPNTSDELRFIARETKPESKYKLFKGTIKPDEVIEIRSLMNICGAITIDGDTTEKRMKDFDIGKTIQIRKSDKPLNVITF